MESVFFENWMRIKSRLRLIKIAFLREIFLENRCIFLSESFYIQNIGGNSNKQSQVYEGKQISTHGFLSNLAHLENFTESRTNLSVLPLLKNNFLSNFICLNSKGSYISRAFFLHFVANRKWNLTCCQADETFVGILNFNFFT